MRGITWWAILLALMVAGPLPAQEKTVTITITAESADCKDTPVCIPLSVHTHYDMYRHAVFEGSNQSIPGQLTAPGIMTEHIAPSAADLVRRDLHVIVPALKKGASLTLTAKLMPL